MRTLCQLSLLGIAASAAACSLLVACSSGDFSLGTPSTRVTVSRGSSLAVRISLTRSGGFACEIEFSVMGLPAGLAARLDPVKTTGDATVLTIIAGDAVTSQEHTLKLVATGGGRKKEATIVVNVALGEGASVAPTDDGVAAAQSEGCAFLVRPGESIQKIIDAAPDRARICLSEGVWRENLVIPKSLTLEGAGPEKSVVEGSVECRPVVQIGGDEDHFVAVENLTVRNARGKSTDCVAVYPAAPVTICPDGIAIHGQFVVHLKDLHVLDNGRMGIYVTDYAQVSIFDCIVSGSERIGLFVRRYATATVEGTIIRGNNEGVNISDSAHTTLRDTRVEESRSYGVLASGQPVCTLEGCTIAANGQHGLALWNRPRVELIRCLVQKNKGWGIVKMAPYSGVLSIDAETKLLDNERSGVGSL